MSQKVGLHTSGSLLLFFLDYQWNSIAKDWGRKEENSFPIRILVVFIFSVVQFILLNFVGRLNFTMRYLHLKKRQKPLDKA
jgi:hypothetical protein